MNESESSESTKKFEDSIIEEDDEDSVSDSDSSNQKSKRKKKHSGVRMALKGRSSRRVTNNLDIKSPSGRKKLSDSSKEDDSSRRHKGTPKNGKKQ
jgi:hypothetical protein